jgi:hypothetical protein
MAACIPVVLFVGMFLLYFSTSLGFFVYGDDISMLDVTRSIVEQHSVTVPDVPFPASAIGADGNHYSKYGIGQSVLAIPFHIVGSLAQSVFTVDEFADADGVLRSSLIIYTVRTLGSVDGRERLCISAQERSDLVL